MSSTGTERIAAMSGRWLAEMFLCPFTYIERVGTGIEVEWWRAVKDRRRSISWNANLVSPSERSCTA